MSKITPRSTGRDAVAMLLERDTVARCEERRRTSEERVPNMRSSRVPEGVMDGPIKFALRSKVYAKTMLCVRGFLHVSLKRAIIFGTGPPFSVLAQ